jgi:hypothetical protein
VSEKHANLIVEQKVFDSMINAAVALVEEIRGKSNNKLEVTIAEADFANAFVDYSQALINSLKKQKEETEAAK